MSDLLTYDFNTSVWSTQEKKIPNPGPLFGHKMIMLPSEEGFLIFGGQSSTNAQ